MKKTIGIKVISVNKKAYHDYEIKETYEAGIVLNGLEIKSIRNGKVSLVGSYAKILGEELWLINCHIENPKDPTRPRKLLIHKDEIKKLFGLSIQKGFSLIPLKIYFKRGKAKLEIGLSKGRKIYHKKEILKKRDLEREIKRRNY